MKHVKLVCPDGAAVVAYAGVGRIGISDVSDWIRHTLHGETRTVDASIILLREAATRDLGALCYHRGIRHMFSIGAAFKEGGHWGCQVRNFEAVRGVPGRIINRFDTIAQKVEVGGVGLSFGPPGALLPEDAEKLTRLASVRPRNSEDFQYLLAAINRRAAATPVGRRTISSGCVTSCLSPSNEGASSILHGGRAGFPWTIPVVLFGIDMTDTMRDMSDRILRDKFGGLSADELQEVTAKNEAIARHRRKAKRPR